MASNYIIPLLFTIIGVSLIVTLYKYFCVLVIIRDKNETIKELKKEMNFRQTSFLIPLGFVEINEQLFYKHFNKLQKGVRLYVDMERKIYINEQLAAEINQYEIEEERSRKELIKINPIAGLEDHIYTPIC